MATAPSVLSAPSVESHRGLGTEIGEYLRHLDYLLLAAVAGLVAYGLWILQTVTHDDAAGRSRTTSSSGRRSSSCVGVVAFAAASAINPELYRRLRYPLYIGLLVLLVGVLVAAPDDPRVAAVDRPRLVPAPALRARQARHDRRHRELPREPGQASRRARDGARRDRPGRSTRRCSSSSSRTSARRSSTAPRSPACCASRASAGRYLAALALAARSSPSPCSGSCRRSGIAGAQGRTRSIA